MGNSLPAIPYLLWPQDILTTKREALELSAHRQKHGNVVDSKSQGPQNKREKIRKKQWIRISLSTTLHAVLLGKAGTITDLHLTNGSKSSEAKPPAPIWVLWWNWAKSVFTTQCSWPLNTTGLNCSGLLIHGFFSMNILENYLEICGNLKKQFL